MKKLIPIILLTVFASCASLRDDADPAVAQSFQQLEQAELVAKADLADAQATGDEAQIAAARMALEQAEGATAQYEAEVLKARAGPLVSTVSAFLGPIGLTLSPLLMGLVPLAGRRGRKHFGKALKQLNPWKGPESGAQPGIAPVAAMMDLARMVGLKHSSEGTEKEFEKEEAAPATAA